ncbi:MAG: hypothetical protein ACPLRY_07060 [Candidatus Bathyarchaeales archaeon]
MIPSNVTASNCNYVYTFHVTNGYLWFSHKLYISVPPSLYNYYHSKDNNLYGTNDYSKFITPDAVRPIAENIQKTTRNMPNSDEQFANAVLMIVHQLVYVKSNAKYPVETLVDNSGDCGALSLLAASIMKAGGLDVVLLYYEDSYPNHMNVGVHLENTPAYHTWWTTPKYYEYNGKKYWVAECTPLGDWRVGDQPNSLAHLEPTIISLRKSEKVVPAFVSASLDAPLNLSFISITIPPEPLNLGNETCTLPISGSISPKLSGKRVTVYISQDGISWKKFVTAYTDKFGKYSLAYNITSTGAYYFKASWSGDSSYIGVDSKTLTVFIKFPLPLIKSEMPQDPLSRASSAGLYRVLQLLHNQTYGESSKIVLGKGENVSLSGEFVLLSNETNNQFSFFLRHDGENYYIVSVKVIDTLGTFQVIKKINGKNKVLINASVTIREGAWHRVTAETCGNQIIAKIYDANGTLLRGVITIDDALSAGECGILAEGGVNTVLAIKNLKIEILDTLPRPAEGNQSPLNELQLLAPYIKLIILLTATLLIISYVNKRKGKHFSIVNRNIFSNRN